MPGKVLPHPLLLATSSFPFTLSSLTALQEFLSELHSSTGAAPTGHCSSEHLSCSSSSLMCSKAKAFCLSRLASPLFSSTRLQSQEERDGVCPCCIYIPSAQYIQQAGKGFCEIRRPLLQKYLGKWEKWVFKKL